MARGNGAGGGRGNRQQQRPLASTTEGGPPTNYPTYFATTYHPTWPWPTYAPTAAWGEGQGAQRNGRKPSDKGNNTNRGKRQDEQEQGVAAGESPLTNSTEGPTGVPTAGPSVHIDPSTSSPTRLPTPLPTPLPTVHPTAAMGGRPGSTSGNAPSRYYGERLPSHESVHRPLSHGGLGTEMIPTPSPVERGASRQSGGRGSYSSERSSSARLDDPAASSEAKTTATTATTAATMAHGTGTSSTIAAPNVAFEKRLEPHPAPVDVAANEQNQSFRGSMSSRGRGPSNPSTDPPETTSLPTSAAPTPTPPPTPVPTPAPMAVESAGRGPSRPSRASDRQPSRYSPPGNSPSYASDADPFASFKEPTEPAEPAEVEVVVPPEALAKMGSNEARTREEPKQTTKLNLSFPVKEVPAEDATSKLSLKFYGRGQPAPAPTTEEPTYILYPTYGPTTAIPTYAPTGQGSSEDKPSHGDNKRHGFKEPAKAPTVADVTDAWTWKPSPSPVGSQSEFGQEAAGQEPQSDSTSDALSSIYDKRICPGYPFGIDPMMPKSEEEVFFAYGIQTTEGKHGRSIERSVERMQLWVLEDVAQGLLRCPGSDSVAVGDGRDGKEEVSSVYYVEEDSVATMSPCTPTVLNATDCAIVQSAVYLTATHGHEGEARANALSIIHHRLQRGAYEQGTILHTSYLGPDLDTLDLFGASNGADSLNEETDSSAPPPASFYIAIAVVTLAVGALAIFFAMRLRLRRERKKSVSVSSVPSHRSADTTVNDDLHVPYLPSTRAQR